MDVIWKGTLPWIKSRRTRNAETTSPNKSTSKDGFYVLAKTYEKLKMSFFLNSYPILTFQTTNTSKSKAYISHYPNIFVGSKGKGFEGIHKQLFKDEKTD